MADERRALELLKRKKDKEERASILARMAEDKAERLARAEQSKIAEQDAAEAASSSISAFRAEQSAADTSSLVIRAEEGAFRNTFPASTTLLQVRDWLIDEQRRKDALARGGGASSHVLTSNEEIEAVRQGRENFERQTARLREEARAMRLAAATGDGRGLQETRVFFVTLTPKAEYLSEEAMAATLAEAQLVPHGTLMVRRQLVAPPPPPDGQSGAEDADATADFVQGREEDDEDDEDDEGPAGGGAGMDVSDGPMPAQAPNYDDNDDEEEDEEDEDDGEEGEEGDGTPEGLIPAGFLANMRGRGLGGGPGGGGRALGGRGRGMPPLGMGLPAGMGMPPTGGGMPGMGLLGRRS